MTLRLTILCLLALGVHGQLTVSINSSAPWTLQYANSVTAAWSNLQSLTTNKAVISVAQEQSLTHPVLWGGYTFTINPPTNPVIVGWELIWDGGFCDAGTNATATPVFPSGFTNDITAEFYTADGGVSLPSNMISVAGKPIAYAPVWFRSEQPIGTRPTMGIRRGT